MKSPKVQKTGKKLTFWLGYALFILLIIEISLRVLFSVPQFSKYLAVNDSLSWRRQWVNKQRQNQNEIYYTFDQYSPTLGWSSLPNQHNVPAFENKILNTNYHGLRGNTDISYDRVPGKARILILGDSFTFGDEVSDDETYASYLQAMLPQVEVINMGVHGYGHDQMLLLYLEEGLKYHADIVIIGFVSADMERNVISFRDFAKPMFIIRDEQLVLTHSPVQNPEDILKWDWLRPRIWDAISLIAIGSQEKSGARQDQEVHVTRLILDQWVDAVSQMGSIPILAYLPVGDELTSSAPQTSGENFLLSYCETNQAVHCFSARQHFVEAIQAGTSAYSDFHWDPSGHRAVAEALFDFLVNNHFVSP